MQRLAGSAAVPSHLAGGIVALGNFDGFHLGHQAVVGRAVDRARAEGRPALVATFDPHPVRHFQPDAPPFRRTSLDQRELMFAQAGADAMLVFGFDGKLAATSAEEFVADLLAERIGAAGVVTGEDFTFGAKRTGNAAVLAELGARAGIVAETVAARPDAVLFGHSGSSSGHPIITMVARAVVRALPDVRIVYGGGHPTYFWRRIHRDRPLGHAVVPGQREARGGQVGLGLGAGAPLAGR